jgi:hypothetical protein
LYATLIGGHVAVFNCGHLNLHMTGSEPPMHRFTVIIYEYFSSVEAHAFCCRLISQQSPFPLPPQLSKHLPNLSLSLSSLCKYLPVQADRRGRGEEPDKTTGKNLNFFPCIPFTYSISQWRTQYYTKTHHPLLCTDMYYMETWTCPYVHNSYI